MTDNSTSGSSDRQTGSLVAKWPASSLSLLHEMFENLASTLDETEALSRAASIISCYFDNAVVLINVYNELDKTLELRASSSLSIDTPSLPTLMKLGQGITGRAADQRQTLVVNDVRECEYYQEFSNSTRSEVACPILHGDNLLGVLNIESDRVEAFSASDIKAIEILAGALAISINNARSFRRVQELNSMKDALLERLSHDYQNIFENALQGMSRSTLEGRFIIANPSLARILGYSGPDELLKLDIERDIYRHHEHRQQLVEMLERDGAVTGFETQFQRSNGQIIDVKINARTVRDFRGLTLYYDEVVEDISEQKLLRLALARRERMAMMGELAAAIAHEIRNPLAAVLNSAEELQVRLELKGTNQRLLEIILEEVKRLESIVRDFLDFARPSEPKLAAEDLHQILDKTLELVAQSNLTRPGVKIERQFASTLPPLNLDAGRMIQVFLNILLNASQAIKKEGTITINTTLFTDERGKEQARVTIADTGLGISNEHLDRIFEPFFTTKPSGTGLGLPIAKQIIEAHGGTIAVESSDGRGTTVTIKLPIKK